jgi:hypothetical protein
MHVMAVRSDNPTQTKTTTHPQLGPGGSLMGMAQRRRHDALIKDGYEVVDVETVKERTVDGVLIEDVRVLYKKGGA